MNTEKKNARALTPHELTVFCSQLSMLIKSGSSPYESIGIMLADTKDRGGRAVLEEMNSYLSQGEKLHTAVTATGVFPEYAAHMITIGEESGELDTVLDALSSFYESEDNLNESIRAALSYPLIMIGIMFVVIVVLITQVLPIFSQVFAQLGTGMNAFSDSLLRLGVTLNRYSLAVVVVLIVLALFFLYLFRTPGGKKTLRRIGGRIPAFRRLSDEIAAGRFAGGMALMLSSGMDTYQSLEMVRPIVENGSVEEKISETARLISEEGCTFPEALEKTSIFTQLYTRMVKTGFKSGSLDNTLRQIADHYARATARKLSSLISIVEPTLIIVLSVIVGLILLSVIMPLMGIMGSIG